MSCLQVVDYAVLSIIGPGVSAVENLHGKCLPAAEGLAPHALRRQNQKNIPDGCRHGLSAVIPEPAVLHQCDLEVLTPRTTRPPHPGISFPTREANSLKYNSGYSRFVA